MTDTERRKEKSGLRRSLLIVLDTAGGIIEVVERMVNTIRHHCEDVTMVIPRRAMSAGTVLAMSGDRIMMGVHRFRGIRSPPTGCR
ncbi:MAG: hypothetical protein EA424_22065 [Planctomycetaceae bacterium]|nr:MAG: hypothetical protein EA424_22065 [Planctomycetaceae bacterium]